MIVVESFDVLGSPSCVSQEEKVMVDLLMTF